MAGTNPRFNSTAFRTGIRFVFNMAAPPLSNEQVFFYFPSQLIYNSTSLDGEGVPFDPAATVTRQVPAPVQVPCGVGFTDTSGQQIDFGLVIPAKLEITLLDEDYQQVEGCSYVVVRGEKYNYVNTEPPTGLFDVGIYALHFVSESST